MAAVDTKFSYSAAEWSSIKAIQFGILSPQTIRKMSEVEVKYAETFEDGKPKMGGLTDPRMGTCDKSFPCETCGADIGFCPGHFGHLELAKPVFHIGYLKTVVNVLRCVCHSCSLILSNENDESFVKALKVKSPASRLKLMVECCKYKWECATETKIKNGFQEEVKHRGGCGAVQPKYSVEGLKVKMEYKKRNKKVDEDLTSGSGQKSELTAEMALTILKRISDEQCEMLGLNPKYARPEWMILEVLPVPPPAVRPHIKMEPSLRSEDDLTHILGNIIRDNNGIRNNDHLPPHVINEKLQLLQFNIAAYMNNDMAGQPKVIHRSGRPIKSIYSRLKSKDGRIRGNLMGKRVDFSARTVITADPNIKIYELGVPRSIANQLSYPEVVTPVNIHRYGWNAPPGKTGAKHIIRQNGTKIDLRYARKDSLQLDYGCIVERNLEDGDLVLFNRQPSLHKMSIMGHKIRIMPWSTFRLNLSVTSPYNADFDGDEMNMHVPQCEETKAEIQELMLVPHCIVSPQSNRPVMGIVQDTLLGCRKITKRDTFIEKDVFMNTLLWWEDFDGKVPMAAILKPRPLWTGKQVFNLIIPEEINLIRYSAWHSDSERADITPGDTCVRIEKGELLSGTLCRKTLGSSSGGLIHVIWEEVGPESASKFLGHTQWLVNYWLLHNGFTVGIGDTITDSQTRSSIKATIAGAKTEVADLISRFRRNALQAEPGRAALESLENKVNQLLNRARDDAGLVSQRGLPDHNNLNAMLTAGSKGSFINISQMAACVGQQNVEGGRIPALFRGGNGRTLPHFEQGDAGPASRGFVEASYVKGLAPDEFFFHAMGGRQGLIDTAIKTSETGYIQRRLVKAMEDLMVAYDGTVRNSLGHVVQFLYGDDGLDASWLENQKLDSLRLGDAAFRKIYDFRADDHPESQPSSCSPLDSHRKLEPGPYSPESDPEQAPVETELQVLAEDRRLLATHIAPSGDATWPLPANLRRIIWNAQKLFGTARTPELAPAEVVRTVDLLQNRLRVVPRAGDGEADCNATMLFRMLLRSTLASKRVLREWKLSRAAFQWVVAEIESRFLQSVVAPGEMIGCVAAQSIGEPATQMTLNTFHYAGVSAKNVILGVPRLKELINVARNIRTPSLSVFLLPGPARDPERAKGVQCALEYTTLRSITAQSEIWYDPDLAETIIADDSELVQSYKDMPLDDAEVPAERLSPWVLRLQLSRDMMVDKKLCMADVAQRVSEVFFRDTSCMFSDDNAERLVLRLRIVHNGAAVVNGEDDGDDETEFAERREHEAAFLRRVEQNLLTEVSLRGVPGIHKVFMKSSKITRWSEESGFRADTEWALDTEGVNLLAVLGHDEVDSQRTVSNNVTEVMSVLGVEAARRALLDELRAVISFDGSYVNYRHVAILCDCMTYLGTLQSVTRHGVNRNDKGALMRCSFEDTVDVLLDAAAYAHRDPLCGVSDNIMLANIAPVGTALPDLVLNPSALTNAVSASEDSDYEDERVPSISSHADLAACAYDWPDFSAGTGDNAQFSPYIGLRSDPGYSAVSPRYWPTYSLASPTYSPASPTYSPTSPAYTPVSPKYSPTSPVYTPTSPTYSPASVKYSPASPTYSPASPTYSPASPAYSPASPMYSPASRAHGSSCQAYSPLSPVYGWASPAYRVGSPSIISSREDSPVSEPPTDASSSSSGSAAPPPPSSQPLQENDKPSSLDEQANIQD